MTTVRFPPDDSGRQSLATQNTVPDTTPQTGETARTRALDEHHTAAARVSPSRSDARNGPGTESRDIENTGREPIARHPTRRGGDRRQRQQAVILETRAPGERRVRQRRNEDDAPGGIDTEA
jgi:hypothetical protein